MADENKPETSQPAQETQDAVASADNAVTQQPPVQETQPPAQNQPKVRVITHSAEENREYEDRIRRETRESSLGSRPRDDTGGRVNRKKSGGFDRNP